MLLTVAEGRADLATGLTAYWQFEGNGSDSSPNGRDLTLVGSPAFSANGLFGQALDLNQNSGQFAQRADSAFDLVANNFTLQVWVNFDTIGPEQTLVEKFTGGAGPGYTVTMNSNTDPNRIQVFAAGAANFISSQPVSGPGNWNHVLLRRQGTDFDLFLNGVQNGVSSAATISTSSNPLLIGERDGNQNFPVNGQLDEIAFWNRGLSNVEIASLYNGGSGLEITGVPEPASCVLLCFATLSLGLRSRNRRAFA